MKYIRTKLPRKLASFASMYL